MNEEQAWEMITLLRQDEQFQHMEKSLEVT